ncbi:MAG: MOSC domain-containing protein [Rhodobacteraceae bacterium]|nr:MOSC domain-containing protein [Paracoccaceae bacterium]
MTARLAHVFRHPIKGLGREELATARLSPDATVPHDRRWAVAHEAAALAPDGGWSPCSNFARAAKAPELMAITARLQDDESDSPRVTLSHPRAGTLTLRPEEDGASLTEWLAPLIPEGRAAPARLVSARQSLTDSPWPSVSVLCLGSLRALEATMGRGLSIHRFRGNLWLEGTEPWAEFDWLGKDIEIGPVRLRIEERITRCTATSANPETGQVDADTLGALERGFGHRDFGVYARVVAGGPITRGDGVRLP